MLDVPDEDGVWRLLRPEPRERPSLGGPLPLDHLPPREGRRAEVPDLAQTLEVGQRAEGLLDVGVRLGAVDLVQVDVVRAQAPEAVLHLARDPDPRVAPLVPPGPISPWTLVARTTWSRRSFSARPTISSDSPAEYTSAVSTKLIPPSIAAWIMRTQSSTS